MMRWSGEHFNTPEGFYCGGSGSDERQPVGQKIGVDSGILCFMIAKCNFDLDFRRVMILHNKDGGAGNDCMIEGVGRQCGAGYVEATRRDSLKDIFKLRSS